MNEVSYLLLFKMCFKPITFLSHIFYQSGSQLSNNNKNN